MEEEFELKDYLDLIKKHWLLTSVLFIVIFGAVAAYTFTATPVYEVRSLVMVSDQDQTSVLSSQGSRVDIETQKEIIMSASVLYPVYAEYIDEEFEITAEPIKSSNVIEITVGSSDPVVATNVANDVVDSFVNYTQNTKTGDALEVNDFITEQLAEYKIELDNLNSELLDINSERKDYEAELQNIQDEIDTISKEISNINLMILEYKNKEELTTYQQNRLNSLEADKRSKQATLNSLAEQREETRSQVTDLEVQYQALEQNVDAKEELYNYLLSRREEVSITAKERSGTVSVIEYASIPLEPVKPNKPMNLALGFILAVIGSTGFVIMRDFLANTFKSIKDVETTLDTKVVGVIPKLKSKFNLQGQPKYKNTRYNLMGRNKVTFIESIHMLRTNVQQMLKEKDTKVLSVASSQEGDGSSTIASNLALSLAKDGKRVLLIDLNLRNPTQHTIFKKTMSPGYTDVALGKTELSKAIRKSSEKDMDLLTAGAHNNYPSDMFSSKILQGVLSKLSYDAVILDSPSLEFSESSTIAAESDGVIMIVASEHTKKDVGLNAKDVLDKLKVRLLGVVVNFAK